MLLLAAVATVLAWATRWWIFTIDDTYISLRYAHHLASGQGLVFNIGERVEGISCPGWVVTLALVEKLGGAPLASAKALGVASALALVLLLYVALRRSNVAPFISGLAALWLAVLPGLGFFAASGMETLAFAVAVAVAVVVSTPALVPSPAARSLLLPLCLLAAATLRPEGLLVLALLAPLALLQEKERAVRVGVLALVPAVAALLLARHAYYGEWLPNTYLAKPSPLLLEVRHRSLALIFQTLSRSVRPGGTLYTALRHLGGPVLLFGVAIALVRARTARLFPPAAVTGLAGVAFLVYAPKDWMPADRFALPFAFPLVLLGALGMDALSRAATPPVRRALAVAFALLVLTESALQLRETNELLAASQSGILNPALDARKYEEIGRWLAASAHPTDTVLAFEVGAVGYFSGLRIVDHEGLVDREVARIIDRAGGYGRVRMSRGSPDREAVVRYCVRQAPDWFLIRHKGRVPPVPGTGVPDGIAREPIQNALLHELRETLVVAKAFRLRQTPDGGQEWYVVLRRASAAGRG